MKILHQDEHLLVIDKAARLPVLPDGWEKDAPYLVKILEEQYGKLWIVHRLDKTTSGVMVFARDAETHRALNMQFGSHQAEKVYHAIVEGNPKWDEKIARHPLRANVGHKHRTMVDNKNGKPSETRFRLMKRYQAQPEMGRGESALVEARPMTGRTHQVRVHAYALGHPLLGDLLYGGGETDVIARPALHAYSLTIELHGERITFKAPYPDDFRAALESLKR
ncbi:MAG TPA: RluA family pseudouridine synthase [Anaerolineales bacterium]|nr:RluA family pseudouridine synthase [Anaerolineales bacterium]